MSMSAGRAGEAASTGLTDRLVQLGFETDRLKTGTPARVDRRTINFGGEWAQHSAAKPPACFVDGWRCALQASAAKCGRCMPMLMAGCMPAGGSPAACCVPAAAVNALFPDTINEMSNV